MEHLALYRKWRPQTFDALVGQADNAKILKNAVTSQRQAHAYLFCGTRGTGKTSTARILAKALNCHNPQNGEPCNVCESCSNITAGRALDVFEIDAASNRGIDEVRDLLEKVHFVPAEGRYKVYIIDEAHMLTTEAFNALLKTFEEPPSHVIFILATTEPRKVPLTILSRCQRFDFKPIGEDELFGALKVIAKAEELTITDDALTFLAQRAKGSMRDALSLMDQGMGSGESTLTVEELSRIFGSVIVEFWPDFIKNIAEGNVSAVFAALDDLYAEGKDLRGFFGDFQEIAGDLLSYHGDMTQSYGKAVAACRGLLTDSDILTILTVIGENESFFRYQRDNRVVCRFLLAKIIKELSHGDVVTSKVIKQSVNTIGNDAAKAVKVEAISKPVAKAEVIKAKPAAKKAEVIIDEDEEVWSQILLETRKLSVKTYTWLSKGQLKKISDDGVMVRYYASDSLYREKMETPEHSEVVVKALHEIFGKEMTIKTEVDKGNQDEGDSLFD